VLLLATTRRSDETGTRAIAPLLSRLIRGEGFEAIELEGLSRSEVAALARASLGDAASDGLVAALHARSGGNPFFLGEMLHDLSARDASRTPEHVLDALPLTVRELLRDSLQRLPRAARLLVAAAAVLGQRSELDALGRICEIPAPAAARAAATAERAGALRAVQSPVPAYAFAHPLIHEVAYAEIDQAERMRLHERAGRYLEECGSRHDGEVLADLYRHYSAALPLSGAKKALDYALASARWSAERYAHEEAVACYRVAVELAPRANLDDGARLVFELARRVGDTGAMARAAIGSGLWVHAGRVEERQVHALEAALEALPRDERATRARLLALLAKALEWSGDHARRMRLADEAVAEARASGAPDVVAPTLDSWLWAWLGHPDVAGRLAAADELVAIASARRDLQNLVEGHGWRAVVRLECGDGDECDVEIDTYARMAEHMQYPFYVWYARVHRATRALVRGNFERAEALAREAFELGRALDESDATQVFGAQLVELRFLQGRHAEVAPLVESQVERFPQIASWRAALAYARLGEGQLEQARRAFDAIRARGFDFPRDMTYASTLRLAAEVCAELEDADAAALLLERLLPFAGCAVVLGFGVLCFGAVDATLARLSGVLGRSEDADDYYASAVRFDERLGARPYTAAARAARGEVLLARGRRADAETELERAEREARALGMDALALRAHEARMRAAEVAVLPRPRRSR
jgi:tetratricopeptide (TPR) repeat protein